MEGVTTALVLFIFLGVTFPVLIKTKPQFYAALAAVVVVIFLDALAHVIHTDAFIAFAYFINAILQVFALVLLVLSAGGMTFGEFKSEIGDAAEAIRRGENPSEVVIPLSESAKVKIASQAAQNRPARTKTENPADESPKVFKIDDPVASRPRDPKPDQSGPLPLV